LAVFVQEKQILKSRENEVINYLVTSYQGRNQDFAKGGGGLKMENFCNIIL